jgi:hypothetical protein
LDISDENQWIDLELDGYGSEKNNLTLIQIRESVPSYRLDNLMYFDTRNNLVLMRLEMMNVLRNNLKN